MLYSDSIWDTTILLGVPDIMPVKGQLLIYPNPAKDHFVCSFENATFVSPKTEVYNLMGELVFPETRYSDDKIEINSSNLCSGFYIVKITDTSGTFTGKILVSK